MPVAAPFWTMHANWVFVQNENKTLSDTQVRSQNAWDERYSGLMRRMDDYQEEKDNPRKQVVAMEMDELYVATARSRVCVFDADDNHSFRQRFKSLIDQYELRELHFHSQMRTKELEVQYHSARYEAEKKKYEEESSRTAELSAQVETFVRTEGELRQQLNVYVDKFKQVGDSETLGLYVTPTPSRSPIANIFRI